MASFNRVVLVGNLTRDVELKYLQSGTAVTEIGLAVNDRRKNQQTGEWIDEPVFVDVTLWGRTAEIASEYLGKGSNILIEGRLKFDQWEKDGQKRSKLRVVAETMQMLGAKGGGGSRAPQSMPPFDESEFQATSANSFTGAGAEAPARAPAPAAKPAEDIPF
jgi:single-strand DNA-binding protein